MIAETAIRFVVGGLVVSLFALVGEMFKPKTFAGLFGAAPSVALVTLGLAYAKHGAAYVGTEAQSMLIGAVAFLVYSVVCVIAIKRASLPVWLEASLAWGAWAAVALGSWMELRVLGVVA
jgi:uncharacterized membrane protein (GlpM family)